MNQPGAGHSQPTAAADSLFPGFPTLDLGRLVSLVKKRLWLAALIAACFVGMALAYVFLAPKIFQSSAVIYVDPASEGSVFDGIRGAKQASWETLDALKSMAEGIRNGTVILRVVDRLSLRDDPTFLPSRSGGYTDAEVVEAVSKQVRAELRRGTRLIDISVKDRSPERARDMTTAFVEEFQALIREQNGASAEEVRKRLEIEAENQRERLQEANNRIHAFRIEHADVALDEEEDFVRNKLSELDTMLGEAANEVLIRKAQLDQLEQIEEGDIERVFEVGDFGEGEHIQKLLLARSQKRAEFVRIKKQFKPSHPTYQAYEGDLAGLEDEVLTVAQGVIDSIEKGYERAKAHEFQLRETVQEQKEKLIKVDSVRKEFYTLVQARDSVATSYEGLLDRINDADVTRGVDETVVRLFSEPLVAAKPVSPKKKLTLAIAGVFGTGVGLAVVLGIGLLDRTLNSRKQIESTLGLAVLAEVPKAFNREWELQDSLFVNRDPHSIVSESFRSLRTSLSAYRARSVMITSAGPEEGKSFCAANLAVLQANLGYRTLLVDADFCRPKMAEIFIDPMHGSIGEGALTTQNLCQPTSFQNLFLITCGRFTSESGAPMSEQVFARMLRESYASFDCVIIDSSPLNMVSDGLNLAPHVDATVLVIKAGQTVVESARLAMHELQRMRARLAGCILNGSSNVSQAQVAYVSEATRMLPERAPDLAGAQY